MFTTLDLSLNQYHHVFFQVEPDTSNVLTTYMYDNAMNSLGTIDVSFGTQSIVSALTSFDQNGANPYAIGVDHTGSTKVNMDLAFWGMYTSALKDKQRQTLMKFTNQTLLEPHSQATIYMVTVENGKFYVDGVQQAFLLQNPGYYVFDQRHSSNASHPLLLSTTEHGTHGGGIEYTTGVVKNGTPGSLNAYTLIQVTENTPDLFYYCANHSNMGGTFSQVDTVYYVKVVQNVLGEYVYALSTSANGPYYNQMDLSFNAGETYLFNVGDSSNDGYRLEFGTTVDDVATINTANVVRDEDEIVLNLSGYTGDALYYFEDSSGGMGYVEKPITIAESGNTSELLVDINDWTDSVESLANFIAFCAAQGLTVTSSNVTRDNTSTTNYTFPSANHFKFWTNGDCYLEFTSPVTGTCELHYGNYSNLTQVYLNEVVIDSLTGNYVSKVVTFDVSSGDKIWLYENGGSVSYFFSIKFTYTELVSSNYDVTIVGSPLVFDLSGTPQREVLFSADSAYVFDQSDPSNDGYQIVFGTEPDASMNYITGKTIMGTPGQEGAYTLLELPADFTGSLFYYHDTIPYMGYGPLVLSVDNNTASNGDVVTFTVTNSTGVAETYTITGVVSADINGADLSGSIGYGQQVDLSYAITGSGKTMVFSVGDLSANVVIINTDPPIEYEFAVQTNAIGDPVFAVYDVSDSVYYNQPDLSFAALNMYQIDLSSSVTNGGYTLVFGTEVDNSGTVVESGFVTRDTQNNSVTLDLRTYTGDPLVYFEDVSAGMGYVTSPSAYSFNYNNLIDLPAEVAANNYTMADQTDVNNITKNAYHIGHYTKTITPGITINSGYMLYMFWAYVGQNAGSETVNSNGTGDYGSNLGFSRHDGTLRLTYHGGQDINQFTTATNDSYVPKTITDISAETWTHCAIVNDFSTGTFKAYINGVDSALYHNTNIENKDTFTVKIAYYGDFGGSISDVSINSLFINNNATDFSGAEQIIAEFLAGQTETVVYDVTVAAGVFDLSGIPQLNVQFAADTIYIFDQSDPTNYGHTLVFGRNPDTTPLFTDGVTVMGEAGRAGAYTQIDLSAGFTGDLYYFSDASANMGYYP